MGKGTIVEHVAGALYLVRLDYAAEALTAELSDLQAAEAQSDAVLADALESLSAYATARTEAREHLNACISAWRESQPIPAPPVHPVLGDSDPAQEAARYAVKAIEKVPAPDVKSETPDEVVKAVLAYRKALAAYDAAAKEVARLRAEGVARTQRIVTLEGLQSSVADPIHVWHCQPVTDLAVNSHVITAEVPGDYRRDPVSKTLTIYGDEITYPERMINIVSLSSAGQLRYAETMTPETVFVNAAMEPGHEKWKPLFRYGEITEVTGSTFSVLLEDSQFARVLGDEPQLLVDNQDALLLTDVTVDYPCQDVFDVFNVGDDVLVTFTGQDRAHPVIIGYRRNPSSCGIYLDSGFLSIGIYGAGGGPDFVVSRPLLYQDALTESLPSYLESPSLSDFNLKPKIPVDDETPPSFDYEENSGQLWEKVQGVYFGAAPSNFSGKLRLYAQVKYGKKVPSAGLGVPSNTGGSKSGYGLYTDANNRYWLVFVDPNQSGTSVTITATYIDSSLYAFLDLIMDDPSSTDEQKLIIESYALALGTKSLTVITKTIDTTNHPLEGMPLAYQWHWLWDGSGAGIVLHKNNVNYYTGKYFKLDLDITDGEITADITQLGIGDWAPGTSSYVFAPLAEWNGSVCWGYGMTGSNSASAPLYCYVKSSGDIPGGAQSFVLVSGSFGASISNTIQWFSGCHTPSSYFKAMSSNVHGSIAAHTATANTISTSDGQSVSVSERTNVAVYKLVRDGFTDIRQDSERRSSSFTVYLMHPTCGPAVAAGTYSGARTDVQFIIKAKNTVTNYHSSASGLVCLIIQAGSPDGCVIGQKTTDKRVGIGYDEASSYIQYTEKIEHRMDSGAQYVSTDPGYVSESGHSSTPATTRYFSESSATYLTSFGGVSAQELSSSWTSPISLGNPYTPNIAFVVQGVTSAARCAGADSVTHRINGFPLDVGNGMAAVIGFG